MIFSILKWFVFAATVLLLGQIRVGDDTVAGRFQSLASQAWARGDRELRHSHLYAKLASATSLPDWARRKMSFKTSSTPKGARRSSGHAPGKPQARRDDHPQSTIAPKPQMTSPMASRRNGIAVSEDITPSDRESLMRLLQ